MFLPSLLLGAVLGADVGDRPLVESDRVAVALASRGSICSVVDKRSGREWVTAARPAPLFRFEFSRADDSPGVVKSCDAGQAERARVEPWSRGADRGARVTFTGFEGQPISVVCTIFTRGGDGLVRFGLEATMPSGVTMESVTYPIMAIGSAGANGSHDIAVAGATKGGIHRLSDWKEGETRRFDQPGSLAAGFGCCYGERGGVYTAALDGEGHRKSLFMRRTATGMDWGWTYPCFQRDQFKLPYDIVLTGFASAREDAATDWRDAADLYKAWAKEQAWCARTFAERDDVPAWLKGGAAMVRFTRAWLAEPESIESWFRDYWQKEYPPGAPLIVAYWGWEKVGKWVGPEYFPAYPSDGRFRQLIRRGRDINAHAFLWPSGYNYSLSYGKRADGGFLWDIRDQLESNCLPHAAVRRDGKPMVRDCTWLRGGQHCVMCPGDPWTVAWLNRSAAECARRGAELIQIDQVVGGKSEVCYSRSHGHPPGPGRWSADVFRKQLRTMAADCRAIEPETVVGFEEPNEWFLQEIGIQDYRDCDVIWSGREPASVFAYLYHEYLPTLFQSNRPQTGHDPWALAWCLVQGQIPPLAPRMGTGSGPMVIDGGFERCSDEGPVEFARTMLFPGERWSAGETEIDRAERHGGQASLKLYNPSGKGQALAAQNYETTESFRPGRTYRLSVWMRSQQITGTNGVVLKAFAPGMSALQTWQIPYPANQSEWSLRQAEFCMPEGTAVLRVMLALEGSGAVWLDDLKIEEVLPDGVAADVRRSERPVDHELMRQWIGIYQGEGRPYLLLGKMLHPPPMETAAPVAAGARRLPPVLHNAFEAPDGSRAVVMVNWTTRPQEVRFIWGDQRHAFTLRPWEVRLTR
ncbi:MAG TPA: DUF6259 domain-containing protein [Verrucomicrobiae bacterium]|nr:DUF6259 domain-containing protein [Verrucomicrobiae bacterium]